MSRREIRKEAARRFGPTGWRSALVTFVLDDADVPEASEVNYTTND